MIRPAQLVDRFRQIAEERMRDLPITNPQLEVETIGFRDFGEHGVGVLIAPWFMNLVLLPGTDEWSAVEPGAAETVDFPGERIDFTVCHDAVFGRYLTSVLFRTVVDFPDQDTARQIATEVMLRLFAPATSKAGSRRMTRRALFTPDNLADA